MSYHPEVGEACQAVCDAAVAWDVARKLGTPLLVIYREAKMAEAVDAYLTVAARALIANMRTSDEEPTDA